MRAYMREYYLDQIIFLLKASGVLTVVWSLDNTFLHISSFLSDTKLAITFEQSSEFLKWMTTVGICLLTYIKIVIALKNRNKKDKE